MFRNYALSRRVTLAGIAKGSRHIRNLATIDQRASIIRTEVDKHDENYKFKMLNNAHGF
ncbi:hypothetical protein SARC_06302 [Sphaeroforma arctica JP610]|uniref:Uncharacterized protein n=1 Tax=Sphaeroforma arctica JP610 TaxID=667725 RepID=A0A0L0FX17_9EUKA|nr:hypothetical protein SARC_06302 [Sphaeroforma arctica JP610]KNC81377.1 hypothetical protein SARC_06302 [Sphaeroforma arctica JP610]|eukprot:XP_014155279.1 hypothetical protein SARC_06302 [Sphaeroforma arctica JP610]